MGPGSLGCTSDSLTAERCCCWTTQAHPSLTCLTPPAVNTYNAAE